jgi:hypothetical protein
VLGPFYQKKVGVQIIFDSQTFGGEHSVKVGMEDRRFSLKDL